MSKNFKHSLTVAFLAVMTVCFMIAIMFSFQPVRGGLDKDNYIITLDNLSVVSGAGTPTHPLKLSSNPVLPESPL